MVYLWSRTVYKLHDYIFQFYRRRGIELQAFQTSKKCRMPHLREKQKAKEKDLTIVFRPVRWKGLFELHYKTLLCIQTYCVQI